MEAAYVYLIVLGIGCIGLSIPIMLMRAVISLSSNRFPNTALNNILFNGALAGGCTIILYILYLVSNNDRDILAFLWPLVLFAALTAVCCGIALVFWIIVGYSGYRQPIDEKRVNRGILISALAGIVIFIAGFCVCTMQL